MPYSKDALKVSAHCHWHCLRTQTKREHIAATMLAHLEEVEVFCPRISQVRKTRTGKKRFVEAMFPGYIFAKFNYSEHYKTVTYCYGVNRIVEQGGKRVIPERVIHELMESLPEGMIIAPDPSLKEGADVDLISGPLKGLNGKVLAQLPSGLRVQILLDILGREVQVEADASDIILAADKE